jgi:hypothetical protein
MKAAKIAVLLVLSSSGSHGLQTSSAVSTKVPLYRINLLVHNGRSTLPVAGLSEALEEMNFIWSSQAGICFEITSTKDDRKAVDGFDIWFVPEVPDPPGANGVFKGEHDIWSRDHPNLRPAPNPVIHRAARTSAHELGHGLSLPHYNDQPDSTDSLMASGTLGWHLNESQIRAARGRARQKAIPDTAPARCAGPKIH